MQHSDPLIDIVVQGTELEQMMAQNAQQQRAGVVSHLTQIAYALRQIPKKEPAAGTSLCGSGATSGKAGSSSPTPRTPGRRCGPIQSLMLDGLILRLLSMGERYDLPAVVMTIDELQTLQKLPQLMPLVTEGRKSLRVVLGLSGPQSKSRLYMAKKRKRSSPRRTPNSCCGRRNRTLPSG